jgi:hypothetical protein
MATLDEINRASKHYSDRSATSNAAKIADAALNTCLHAVELLQGRLAEMGYPVSSLVTRPKNGLSKRIERVETHTGLAVPALLKRVWAVVGGISFVDLEDYSHVEFWDRLGIKGKKGFCDGVCIDSCTKDWLEFTIEDFDALVEDDAEEEFFYSISPDGYHKDDISGGDSYGVRDGDWMPALLHFEWSGRLKPSSTNGESIDLMGYLRTSILECGGFPGLLGTKAFEPIRIRLIEHLPAF